MDDDMYNAMAIRDVSVDPDGVYVTCELNKNIADICGMSLFGTHPFPYSCPEIKRVIFNGPATIVLFADGTKSVVKCSENDIYDPEKAVMIAYLKKLFGCSKSQMRKWLNKQTEEFKNPNDILEEDNK